jgi:drug/metabolite transporter (DMT)-like permease
VAIGATDAGANGLYAIAANMSLISVTAVFASLYPAVTALLAWRVHHEQLRRVQVVGVVATLLGVGLMAAGSA